ncbi:hypothetical protein [Arsenicibacter rosenii]|uniref:Uncharacterized protein n=1 Tax=Arsenicibacter rosenii TaxID=1750698 RepID=A0A1S2VP48_9BACT|nr:hypothetical protein [Arsenicibacter rosenii]OIN60005.1 hypothetical protein BLX24_08470 [Arsenicibacter rosenii]
MTTIVVQNKPRRRSKIPAGLIYETLNGRPLYYKGYKEVLSGQRTPETIMGSSSLQAALVSVILGKLATLPDRGNYLLASNRVITRLDQNTSLVNAVAVFERKGLTLGDVCFQVPPKMTIDVDVQVDVRDFAAKEQSYVYEKTEKLLGFGVGQVIWITTQPRKVLVAGRDAHWITHNWDVPVTLLNGIDLNLAALVEEEGIQF